jgi:hypothetical protein
MKLRTRLYLWYLDIEWGLVTLLVFLCITAVLFLLLPSLRLWAPLFAIASSIFYGIYQRARRR